VADPLAWRPTLAHLARQSLARIDHCGLQMHRLTQAILHDRLIPEQAPSPASRPRRCWLSSRAESINGRLRRWAGQYTARHSTPPSRRTIYLMGQQIAKDTRRPKPEARRMAGGQVTGHLVSDQERLKAWEDQTTADELQALSAVYAEAKAYAARSARRPRLSEADKAPGAQIAVAEAQRQRSVWGISDLCLEIHRALNQDRRRYAGVAARILSALRSRSSRYGAVVSE
jgi:hypothetical protein